tara:strand:+ start:314 stop:643 length:330 start_codon:yes stop_codon:yes gene_type:complete
MGVEACLDCEGVVADSAVVCPHCGSKANYEKRNQPSAEEAAKINAERARIEAESERQDKRFMWGCGTMIFAVLLIISIAIVQSMGEEDDRYYTPAEKFEIIEQGGYFDD